jgi:hypothetical protein
MPRRMVIRWKQRFWRGHDGLLLVGYPSMLLLLGGLQALMGKPMWGSLAICALMSVPMIWMMRRIAFPRVLGFDGRRLTVDRDPWNLEDVDSISIGPESVRMNLYRPGRAGTEFTATAKEMDEGTWRQVRECCARIERAMC